MIIGGNISRPYVNKRNRLILGEGKKKKKQQQRGGFIAPIAAALAPVATNLVPNYSGKMAQRYRIVMVKRQNPKRVTLPNGRTFYARYRHATRAELPANVRLNRPYRWRVAPKGRRR